MKTKSLPIQIELANPDDDSETKVDTATPEEEVETDNGLPVMNVYGYYLNISPDNSEPTEEVTEEISGDADPKFKVDYVEFVGTIKPVVSKEDTDNEETKENENNEENEDVYE